MTAALRRMNWASHLLGFSLGGFFDGILLHQILRWRHLLSRVKSGMVQDIRVQILADGLFHALMYLIGAWACTCSEKAAQCTHLRPVADFYGATP